MSPCRIVFLLVAAVSLPVLAEPAEAQTRQPAAARTAAYKFPASVGPFRRTDVINYTPDGRNRSASYTAGTGVLTAYVYPASVPYSPSLPSHFEECRREIRQLWGRTRSISKRSVSINRNGRQYPGIEEVFSGKAPRTKQEVISRLVVFATGDRYVKFRFTSPKALSDQAAAQLPVFIGRFPWPAESPARSTRL
jgi:hypothetical protein